MSSAFSIENILSKNKKEPTSPLSQASSSCKRGSTSSTSSDPDYTLEQEIDSTGNAKRARTSFSTIQLRSLELYFRACAYPDSSAREQIAQSIGVGTSKVQIWFQNRRARYRKKEKNGYPLQRPLLSPPPDQVAAAYIFSMVANQTRQGYRPPVGYPFHHFIAPKQQQQQQLQPQQQSLQAQQQSLQAQQQSQQAQQQQQQSQQQIEPDNDSET